MFKISTSEVCTLGMRKQIRAWIDEFLAMVTEGVAHGVYKVVTWSSFSVARQHKVSGSKLTFCHCVTQGPDKPWTVVEGQGCFAQCL